MKLFRRVFNFIVFMQTILFFIFILENIENLDAIVFTMDFNGNDETITVNFFAVLIALSVIILIVVVAGINFFGSGLNDTSSKLLGKYVSLIALASILTIATNYYILYLGYVGIVIDVIILIVYLVAGISNLGSENEV